MEKDFIDKLRIGAIVTKRSGGIVGDKNGNNGEGKEGKEANLNFSDPETHKKFVDCIFSAVKGK